jgi:stage II sporulation protein AA (anti-sigma F factor antagonist)
MDIRNDQVGAVSIVAPEGRLDTGSASDLELALSDLETAGSRHFLIDLAGISYVSSAGLRVLLMLAKRVDGSGSLRLAGLNPQVQQVFDIAGFTKIFRIFPDRAAALRDHPAAAESGPPLGRLAATLMGARVDPPPSNPAEQAVAAAAADLLGARRPVAPAPTPATGEAAKPARAPAAGHTMALKQLKTPTPLPQNRARGADAPAAPGFFARLIAKLRGR